MDESKLRVDPKDFYEGEEAARRFAQGVRNILKTSPEELKKRHTQWEKERKTKNKQVKR